ncbi:MAG: hypothetical protein LH468_01190 [Nocardioides sp.]|nr:hypothetical protein [Nocardioides sp.]
MSDRGDVEPVHVLRAALEDSVVRDVLELCGACPTGLRLTLERRWLATLDGVDTETLHARGVEVAEMLRDLGPGRERAERGRDRQVAPAAREVLGGALRDAAADRAPRVASWHLLVGLVTSTDPLVAATFAEHGVRARDVRRVVRRLGRRA